ncbi:MAG: hypothetical protein ACK5MD_10605 [Flavobacteriales bacterium]
MELMSIIYLLIYVMVVILGYFLLFKITKKNKQKDKNDEQQDRVNHEDLTEEVNFFEQTKKEDSIINNFENPYEKEERESLEETLRPKDILSDDFDDEIKDLLK